MFGGIFKFKGAAPNNKVIPEINLLTDSKTTQKESQDSVHSSFTPYEESKMYVFV